jgi:GNAT superfamily N-acetyltransferase
MTFRMLPPKEWNKLKPLLQSEELPDPAAGVFVLEEGDEILAMRTVGQMVWAGGMVVHPDHRRKGLATILQVNVEEALRGAGLTGTYYMFPGTPEAEETVRSFGFTELPLSVYKKELSCLLNLDYLLLERGRPR